MAKVRSSRESESTVDEEAPIFPEEEDAPTYVVDPTVSVPIPVMTPRLSTTRDLSGEYRVREGYTVAYSGEVSEEDKRVGNHAVGKPGDVVKLTHDEALSLIRLTKDQRDKEGRVYGPAIESQKAYKARKLAEEEHDKFLAEVSGVNPLAPTGPFGVG